MHIEPYMHIHAIHAHVYVHVGRYLLVSMYMNVCACIACVCVCIACISMYAIVLFDSILRYIFQEVSPHPKTDPLCTLGILIKGIDAFELIKTLT